MSSTVPVQKQCSVREALDLFMMALDLFHRIKIDSAAIENPNTATADRFKYYEDLANVSRDFKKLYDISNAASAFVNKFMTLADSVLQSIKLTTVDGEVLQINGRDATLYDAVKSLDDHGSGTTQFYVSHHFNNKGDISNIDGVTAQQIRDAAGSAGTSPSPDGRHSGGESWNEDNWNKAIKDPTTGLSYIVNGHTSHPYGEGLSANFDVKVQGTIESWTDKMHGIDTDKTATAKYFLDDFFNHNTPK